MQKKIPMRMCVVCRQSKPKKELVRVLKQEDGSLLLDETGKMQGRGAYICLDRLCIEKAHDTKVLAKTLHTQLGEENYLKLKRIVEQRGE